MNKGITFFGALVLQALFFLGAPTALSANSLNVEFSGELLATTCQVAAESVNKNVTLSDLHLKFINANETSVTTPFSIAIEKCSQSDLQKSIKLTFQSNQLVQIGENSFLKTQGDSGVLLGVVDKDDNPVIWNKPMSVGAVSEVENAQQLDFGVFVRKPASGEAKAGDFTGTVTFNIEYE